MNHRFYVKPFYYFTEKDKRIHFDKEKYLEVKNKIVALSDDKCPNCGGKENLTMCRCPESHRYCPCGTVWMWYIDVYKGTIKLRII